MNRRLALVNLAVGAVFLAGFAGASLRPPAPEQEEVGWRVVEEATAPAPAREELEVLRREVSEIREALPAARSKQLAALPIPAEAILCGQRVALDRPEIRERLAYELVLAVGRPLMPMLWARRAPGVLPEVERKLAEAGLPADLKYLAMVESDLRETVRSPAGALGLWQFMPATARRYDLQVDRFIDERMDPDVSTDAAIRYLRDLHEQFGDWFLALAAYNAGETRVQTAIDEQGAIGYFDMYLPAETRRYVYRILAAKILDQAPEAYGLERMEPLHVPRYKIVEVEVRPARADLRTLAEQAGAGYAALRLANPKLLSPWLPRGTHRLRVPDTGESS